MFVFIDVKMGKYMEIYSLYTIKEIGYRSTCTCWLKFV